MIQHIASFYVILGVDPLRLCTSWSPSPSPNWSWAVQESHPCQAPVWWCAMHQNFTRHQPRVLYATEVALAKYTVPSVRAVSTPSPFRTDLKILWVHDDLQGYHWSASVHQAWRTCDMFTEWSLKHIETIETSKSLSVFQTLNIPWHSILPVSSRFEQKIEQVGRSPLGLQQTVLETFRQCPLTYPVLIKCSTCNYEDCPKLLAWIDEASALSCWTVPYLHSGTA